MAVLTSREVDPLIIESGRDGVWISDDAAQTIASWYHSPAAADEQLARLSHGLEFDPGQLLARVDALIKSDEFRRSDALLDLQALRDWVLRRVRHVEITTVSGTGDEWSQCEGDPSRLDSRTEVFLISEYTEEVGVNPGDPGYPADLTGLEVFPDGTVWVPESPVVVAVEMLTGRGTQLWVQECSNEPGGHVSDTYSARYEYPDRDCVEEKSAQFCGFSNQEMGQIYRLWKSR